MSAWERLLQLTAASPFTGTWMSLATATGALVAVLLARRALPPEHREYGGPTMVLLSIGLVLGAFRLLLVVTGAHFSTAGKVIGLLTTFFVALGAVNAAILFVFELAPARTSLRLPAILRDLIQMLAFVVILFGSLSQSGSANFASYLTTSAVLTAVVGLALQSTIANLFAGIVLHMDRAVAEGDWVQVGERTGRITQIRWRSTTVRTMDGDSLIIPNGQLTAQEVYNYSRPQARHRVGLRVGFAYHHPPNEVRQAMLAAVRAAPGVLGDPPPDCFPVEFADSAVVYLVRFWIPEFGRRAEVEGEIRTRIWYAARRAGLEMPFPTRTVHLHEAAAAPRPAMDGAEREQRLALLRRMDLFAGLDAGQLELLAQGMRRVPFAAGEPIIRQGEPGDSLFAIAEGDVLVSLGAAGIDQSVTTLRPGDFFGEMSLVTGEPRNATCSARTDVVCYVIDHQALQPLLTERPQLAEQLSSLLATRQATLEKKEGELSARAARAAEHRTRLLARIRSFFNLR